MGLYFCTQEKRFRFKQRPIKMFYESFLRGLMAIWKV